MFNDKSKENRTKKGIIKIKKYCELNIDDPGWNWTYSLSPNKKNNKWNINYNSYIHKFQQTSYVYTIKRKKRLNIITIIYYIIAALIVSN